MYDEFGTSIARGHLVDLAVGIVIGATFTSVVRSFVDDILEAAASRCARCTSELPA